MPAHSKLTHALLTRALLTREVLALVDEFLIVLCGGRPTFRAAEDAITLGKEG